MEHDCCSLSNTVSLLITLQKDTSSLHGMRSDLISPSHTSSLIISNHGSILSQLINYLEPHSRTFPESVLRGTFPVLNECLVCLPIYIPSPASGATIAPEFWLVVVNNERHTTSFLIPIIFGGNAYTRTSLQRCKKGTCHTIYEPHGHGIKLATDRDHRWIADLGPSRVRSRIEGSNVTWSHEIWERWSLELAGDVWMFDELYLIELRCILRSQSYIQEHHSSYVSW